MECCVQSVLSSDLRKWQNLREPTKYLRLCVYTTLLYQKNTFATKVYGSLRNAQKVCVAMALARAPHDSGGVPLHNCACQMPNSNSGGVSLQTLRLPPAKRPVQAMEGFLSKHCLPNVQFKQRRLRLPHVQSIQWMRFTSQCACHNLFCAG